MVMRDRQSELDRGGEKDGVSFTRRPDAVSIDYLTQFTLGPVDIGDTSQGLLNRAWRVRVIDNEVFYARENDGSWEEDTLLFSFNGAAIVEMDCAFEQNGRLVVVAERQGELWIYWFDLGVNSFVFENFGTGRNPRVVLDNPEITSNSDILVFYISDSADALCFRVQSEEYATEHTTPVVNVANLFLEEIARDQSRRVRAVYSEHLTASGRYRLHDLVSSLYEVPTESDDFEANAVVTGGVLRSLFITYPTNIEGIEAFAALTGGGLSIPVTEVDDEEEAVLGVSFNSIELQDIIIEVIPTTEGVVSEAVVSDGVLDVAIVSYEAAVEGVDANAVITDGTLAVA